MSASKVLLVIGAGGRIGASVAKLFGDNGYKVAIAARSLEDKVNDQGQLQVRADVLKPATITSASEKVNAQFGPPSVVVFNGMWSIESPFLN